VNGAIVRTNLPIGRQSNKEEGIGRKNDEEEGIGRRKKRENVSGP